MTDRTRFDDFADQLTADLERAASARPVRPVRKRRVVFAGAGLALAGTVAALVIGIGGGQKLDVVSEAEAAIAPGAYILHFKTLSPWGEHAAWPGTQTETEQWTTTDPARWRLVQRISTARSRAGKPIKPPQPDGSMQEFSFHDGSQDFYDHATNHYDITSGFSNTGDASMAPSGFGPRGPDPVTTIQKMLASRQVTDRGFATVDGRRVRRLVGSYRRGPKTTWPIEYDVDATTFTPVRIRIEMIFPPTKATPGHPSQVMHDRFDTHFLVYERLPITPDNLKALTIDVPPDAHRTAWHVDGDKARHRVRCKQTC